MSYLKHILLICLFCVSIESFAQSALDEPVSIKAGTYSLTTALQDLKLNGAPIIFSQNRLPETPIRIEKNETLRQLLERLQSQELFLFKVERSHIQIVKFQPPRFTINGLVRDEETGEHLIGATIQIQRTTDGTISNGYGYFSLTLPIGTYDISFSHVGYQPYSTQVNLSSDTYLSVTITPSAVILDEVEVHSRSADLNVKENIPSISRLNIENEAGRIPYFLGEVDIIQNALLQPGIKTIGEDASGIHVRGGRADQNLILLDEATIYNPNHFYGLISVFNPEAVNDVRIMKGFVPPSYGGRSASVMEVRQKEGNANKFGYSGGIGVLSARLLAEGPLKKGKSSFLASGRQSLLNLSLDDFASSSVRRNRIRFQDLNLKLNSRPNQNNTFYLSGYFGNDRNTAGFNSIRNWGNKMVNMRWNHIFSPKLFANFSTFLSEYVYRIESSEEPGAFVSKSRIVDYSLKSDLTYSFNPSNELNFGFSSILHRLQPGDREPFNIDATTNTIRLDPELGLESALYLNQHTDFGPVRFNYGVRYSLFHNLGPEEVKVYDPNFSPSDTTIIDTLSFEKNEIIRKYGNFEPRFSANWIINQRTSLKASYSKTIQYLHLISNTLAPAPTDIWKLSDTYIPPGVSHQYSLGLYKNLKDNQWETNFELYYKDNLQDLAYRNGADLVFNENIETELLIGTGRSYGFEFYAAKKTGKVTGWVSYALSRSETRLNEDEQRIYVLNNFDKTHDLSTTWVYKFSDRISFSSNFILATGIPLTLPGDKYVFEGNLIPHFSDRNKSRLPNYHRLDLSLKWTGKKLRNDGSQRKNRDFWIFTIYNAYARRNVNSYFFRESLQNPGFGEIVQYSIFGTIIPAITYNFKF